MRTLPELERGNGVPVSTATTAVRQAIGVDGNRGRGGACVYRLHLQRCMTGEAVAFPPLPLCDGVLVIGVVELEELAPLLELGLVDGTIFL